MKNWNKNCVLLIVLVCLSNITFGQTFGFNGKKNTLSFFSTGGVRVFPYLIGFAGLGSQELTLRTIKYSSTNQRKEKTTIARYDLRFSYTRLVNKRFGIGAEFGYEKFALPMINYTDDYDNSGYYVQTVSKQSTPVFNVFSYMLVFEFHPSKGVAPIGFSTSVGIGPKQYKFNEKENYRYDQSTPMNNPYQKSSGDIIGINFFYQMNYKKVLNNVMTFDIGMRLHTGFLIPSFSGESTTNEYSKSELRSALFSHNIGSLVSLRAGFSFLL
jgi:hypothetical protein